MRVEAVYVPRHHVTSTFFRNTRWTTTVPLVPLSVCASILTFTLA
jgi:hypothetical protein